MGTRRKALVFAPLGVIAILAGSLFLRSQQTDANQVVLKPIKTVFPVYPDHLKKDGIAGEVIVRVWIDENGEVKIYKPGHIIRSLYPELDVLAVEAVKQWKYAPPLTLGKSRGAWTYISMIFDPSESTEVEVTTPRKPLSDELLAIFDRGWEYCRKMDEVAHFYLCRERISETIKSIVNVGGSLMGSGSVDGQAITVRVNSFVPDLASPKTNRYVNDYQITCQNNRVTELRTPVKPGADKRDPIFGEKPLFSPISMSIPIRLFAPGFRDEYDYSFGEEKRALGKNCQTIVIKARKKYGILIKKATVWVEKSGFRVVKVEVELDKSAIDERILAECKRFYLTPFMTVTYEYNVENKGILFPSRTGISLEYAHLGQFNKRGEKAYVDFRYDQYRFFTVGTDYKIIK